jgi:hypothetical protein
VSSAIYGALAGDVAGRNFAPVAHLHNGPSGGQYQSGACRSKGLVAGEHVPGRFRESTRDLEVGDLAAPLGAEAGAGALDQRLVERMAGGVVGRLDERPAEVAGAVLAERAALVAVAGLVDTRAEAGVAGQLAR